MSEVSPEFRRLAHEVARDSIVTQALQRFVEQIVSEIAEGYAARIKVLEAEVASLREANQTWADMFGPSAALDQKAST